MKKLREGYTRRTALLAVAILVAVIFGSLGKSFFSTLAIVAVSFCMASVISHASRKISKKTGVSYAACAGILTVGIFLILGAILTAVAIRLVRECGDLLIWLSENRGDDGSPFEPTKVVKNFLERIPFFKNNEGAKIYFENITESFLLESTELLGKRMAAILGSILHATPRAAVGTFVFIMSTFYFSVDYYRICARVKSIFPKSFIKGASVISEKLMRAIKGYAKAYFILFLITFCQLFCGLLILRVRFAFLISLGIAAIDIFPVLGSGIVLVPWAAVSFYFHSNRLGTGLLVLYGIVTIVRQIAEPRIVGEGLGIHPLASLLCMFLGMSVFGGFGAVIGPFLAVAVKELLFDKTKKIYTYKQ